ncbi:MAG: glycosyltransferase family 4 protein [Magnetococcales bacterium]|nr:glycosyltransferase [Magnetococcales bacterium]NGZ27023.1 glycosyltransferase family 4 protein [Magnetococcales bacterium]
MPTPLTRQVAYVTAVDVVDNCRAHALQIMKNGYAWWQESKHFELICNLSFDHWCGFNARRIAHDYGLAHPFPMATFPLFHLEGTRFASLYYRLAALRCRWKQVSLAYCRSYEAAWWMCKQGIHTVMESHGLPTNPQHLASLQEFVHLPSFAGLVTITPPLEELFIQLGVPAHKILVEPDGVDLERFMAPLSLEEARQHLALPLTTPLVVYTGHLYEGRGVDEILQAARQLPQVQFLMVGGTPKDVAYWQQKSGQMGLANMTYTGHLANTLLPPYLWAADVLLMPYNSHCSTAGWMSPMKLFEYMAAGRAVVASDLPVLHSVLRHGENGWLVKADDGTALATGVHHLLENPTLRENLARQSREDVQSYDWRKRVGRIIQWLETR